MKKFFPLKSKNENSFEGNCNQNFQLDYSKRQQQQQQQQQLQSAFKSESQVFTAVTTTTTPTTTSSSSTPSNLDTKTHETAAILNFHPQGNSIYTALTDEDTSTERWTRLTERFQRNIWWRHLLAGGLAGAVSRTMTAPMDRVKIYTQVHPHKMGIFGCLKHLIREGGFLSLWRGNGVNVLKIVPESSIKFTAYEKAKRIMRGNDRRESALIERFLAGAAAGGVAQTAVYPLEVLKVRLALQINAKYHGLRDAARKMYLQEGVRSFYRGYLPNILGCVPYGGIEFTVYEAFKRTFIGSKEEAGFLILVGCSCISSITGQCCVYPLALARTRLQSGIVGDIGLLEIFRTTIQNEGIRGLYRGLTPNICKVVPAVTLNFLVYEYFSRYLGIGMT